MKNYDHPDEDLNKSFDEAQEIADVAEGNTKTISGFQGYIIPVIALGWSVFHLLSARFILIGSIHMRAIHLALAVTLVYLSHPLLKKGKSTLLSRYFSRRDRIIIPDYLLAIAAGLAALYIVLDYRGISLRQGSPLPRDIFVGIALILLLLEAARRSLGLTLPIVASVFILYSFLGPYMPGAFAYKGASLRRFIGQITLSTEGIYGIPLDVSANIVFLFVLFGSLLDKAGAGRYFVDLAFSLLGRFRGGPAKAAILASGMTGMVSGSSIANTVTTGTFTIPLMKKVGYPDYKAGAIEVACSTNGQLMPPIMGAAAFLIAEYCRVSYWEVVRAAFIPAVISYIALMYISHLEAVKLGLKGLDKKELPRFFPTFIRGIHFLIPLCFLIVQLAVYRRSASLSVFYAIASLMILMLIINLIHAFSPRSEVSLKKALRETAHQYLQALVAGGKNMMGIGAAVATAGIIVGVVTMGLGGIITELIDWLAGGRFVLILLFTAIASLLLGMGLPTTANYIVMATLTAPVIVTLGAQNDIIFPLLAAHLFVFFFGILADDTPPVGLAAFAAAAIARSNPIKTGIQGFSYDIRTAILPFMFIFNTDLLLHNVTSPLRGTWIFVTALIGMFAFASLSQRHFFTKTRWYEMILLAGIAFAIMRPHYTALHLGIPENYGFYTVTSVAMALFIGLFFFQRQRSFGRVHQK